MNLREIEAFQAVMVSGTASRAADLLGISQPAVTKAIQGLERSIHFALFERAKGRLVPTPEGQLFFREVQQSFAGLTRLRSAAARIRDFGSGDLRIACLSAFSASILPPALARFRAKNPNVAITFQVQSSSVVRDLVASGQFDIGLASDEIDSTGVEAHPYATFRAALAIHPGHVFEKRSVVQAQDLHEMPMIALAPEDTTRREADAIFASLGVKPRVVVETPYSTTVCALVLAGLGCGLVDPVTAPGFLERGLMLRPFEPAVNFRTLLLFPPDRQKSRLVRDCADALLEQRDLVARSDVFPVAVSRAGRRKKVPS